MNKARLLVLQRLCPSVAEVRKEVIVASLYGSHETSCPCANCKLLIGKLKVLEATLEMYMHPENHTIGSTALLYELYNDMGSFSLE
ncbi:hypothetical protein Tco_1562992 [Tanacetum coccineum]